MPVLRTVIKNSKPTICLAFYYLTLTEIKNAKKSKPGKSRLYKDENGENRRFSEILENV
jgi:hypothetical protein